MTPEQFVPRIDDAGDESDSEEQFLSKYAARQVFAQSQEQMLESYIKQSSNLNNGFDFAMECRKAGLNWLQEFMKKHPTLSLCIPESTSLARRMGFNRERVD
ncbi:hypothetical protein JTB14_005792 [Gonioctena quinquepunctata]|nr:hypothetical protein JTB14_005792 [Gonioctena quinquepunctata]